MIRHIVLLRFPDSVDRETRDSIFADLAGLQNHLQGVLGFHAGENISIEGDLMRGNMDGFWFDFEDVASRDAYLVDEKHKAVGARIVAHTEGGVDGVTVFDVEI